ncbi:MAG TPA: SH3 domain-containing protein [Dehalococcoidia bacterium]|jgi:hypothetical protein|nr:SH3 domain-containing protein [Dehalococcoidia bacterium]
MMEPESRGFPGGNLLIPIVGIALLVVLILVVAMVCSGGDDNGGDGGSSQPTPEATQAADASDPEAAIAAYVQTTLNAEYAGPCSGAQTGDAAGKICSTDRGEREGARAFVLGQTLSEADRWVFLEQRGGAWQVTSTVEITSENSAVPGVPWPLRTGAEVIIAGTGSCLNVRTEPGGAAVDCIAEGTRIKLAAGPREANNLQWWQVDGRNGWVAEDYLRYPDATNDATPAPRQTTPAGSATPRP